MPGDFHFIRPEWLLLVPVVIGAELAAEPDAAAYQDRFEEEYRALFARTVAGMDIEITVWSANATTRPQAARPVAALAETVAVEPVGRRQIFDLVGTDHPRTAQAAITEDETTIVLPASRHAIRQPDGCIDVVAGA